MVEREVSEVGGGAEVRVAEGATRPHRGRRIPSRRGFSALATRHRDATFAVRTTSAAPLGTFGYRQDTTVQRVGPHPNPPRPPPRSSGTPPNVSRPKRRSTGGEIRFTPPRSALYDGLGFTGDDAPPDRTVATRARVGGAHVVIRGRADRWVPPEGERGEFQWSVRGSVMMTVHNQHPDHWRSHCDVFPTRSRCP